MLLNLLSMNAFLMIYEKKKIVNCEVSKYEGSFEESAESVGVLTI